MTPSATRPSNFKDMPTDWDGLSRMFPLRPVHDEVDLLNATDVIDELAGHDLNEDQEDYLAALATLVGAYEDEHLPVEATLRGVEALRSLMEDQGMTTPDLGGLLKVDEQHAREIVEEQRYLTAADLGALCERFHVKAELFLRS